MAERTHLSIGEVLSLLREEFPDVTISKIRFLESQGLVDPERTPSGYRKFYDHDVERLRWILRQQREHFLPLKVIKGRLSESGDTELGDSEPGDREGAEEPVAADDVTSERLAAEPPAAPEALAAPPQASITPASGAAEGVPDEGVPAEGVPAERVPAERVPAAGDDQLSLEGRAEDAVAVGKDSPAPAAEPPAVEAAPVSARRGGRSAGSREHPASGPSDGAKPERADRGGSYTRGELAAAAGISDDDLVRLEQFGLIEAQPATGGTDYFDEDALAITRLAAEFGQHGVEARHLRAWKTSAEREASVFEQIVMPMLRQRNPAAREQAYVTLGDLSASGSRLRELLVRHAIRQIH